MQEKKLPGFLMPRLSIGTRLVVLHSIGQSKPWGQPRFKVLGKRLFLKIAKGMGQGRDLTTRPV